MSKRRPTDVGTRSSTARPGTHDKGDQSSKDSEKLRNQVSANGPSSITSLATGNHPPPPAVEDHQLADALNASY